MFQVSLKIFDCVKVKIISYEKESNNTILFPDILIIKSHNNLTFKVYRKHTKKNDYIHFYSHHSNKIKTDLMIDFYLRVFRIRK